jgi:hypothetical protein
VKRFTVIYDPRVETALAYLVVENWDTPVVAKISQASNRIDKLLSNHPENWGTPIHDNVRVLWIPPLEIMHVTFDEDRQVIVFDVKFVPDGR